MKLYVFNPESDLALADFSENYMAPALIRRMADDLAVLPMWWADEEAGVLAASAFNLRFMEEMGRLFPLRVKLVTPPELAELKEPEVCPWGWNPALRKRLAGLGVASASLPDADRLADFRRMAGRKVALDILQALGRLEGCCGTGRCLDSVEACRAYWLEQQGRCVFKAPWSGSGKGLLWCYSDFTDAVAGWCGRVLAVQGMLVGMPIYNKVGDFAMEFVAGAGGEFSFIGYSRFDTNVRGAYEGNRLQSDADIERWLASWVSVAALHRLRERLQQELRTRLAAYRGVLGVDMMVCRMEDGRCAVCPCVEVNLRMNMGVVAHALYRRILSPEVNGRFVVEAFASAGELFEAHQADERACPAVVCNGRLHAGYLPLVPVTSQSRYRAYIQVDTDKKYR